jgi:hypothetical protein
MSIIVTDQPDYEKADPTIPLLIEGTARNPFVRATSIDDLLVVLFIERDDGVGKRYAQAGPSWLRGRATSPLPVPFAGYLVLDEADVAGLAANNLLPSVMMHELAHILGFGLNWLESPLSLLDPTDCQRRANRGQVFSARFTGRNARSSLSQISATRAEVETTGSAACVHWRESTFGNELMTGLIAPGANPISVLTVASLEDIGYGVDYTSVVVDRRYRVGARTERGDGIELSGCLDRGTRKEAQYG